MKGSTVCLLLWSVLATASAWAAQPDTAGIELWLASGPKCNSCDIYAEVATRRGYGDSLSYAHRGSSIAIPIKRVEKDALPKHVLDRLSGKAGPSSPFWPLQLTVIVVRNGEVLYFSHIAESGDVRGVTLPDEQMKPPANPPRGHPSLNPAIDYRGIFLKQWNLEYFVDVALGERAANVNAGFLDPDAAQTPSLKSVNVVLWGAGGLPIKNAYFIAERLQQARQVLERTLREREPRFITLYGRGPEGDSLDTSILRNRTLSFMHPDMPIDYAADVPGLSSVFTALRSIDGRGTLLVHAGHSGPIGIPIWGSIGTVTPDDFIALGKGRPSQLKVVSGGCHSGLFARAVQCGFFAAHPEVVATGCQLSPEAVEKSDDYLHLFFSHVETNGAAQRLDAAHWAASLRLEHHQLSYSTVDALADQFFRASPRALPASMSIEQIGKLRSVATPPEAEALDTLLSGLEPSLQIALGDAIERNRAADKVLQGLIEASSAQRNQKLALPYRLMVPSLARRLVYRSAQGSDPELRRATECEAGSLATL